MKPDNDNFEILFFNATPANDGGAFKKSTHVTNPVDCLHAAAENSFDLVAIFNKHKSLQECGALLELCATLKRNTQTMHMPLLCLLPLKHRQLLERLQNAGVEYVMFYDPRDPDLKHHIDAALADWPEACTLSRILSNICPHINYVPISGHKEIIYCKAYRNRLVLGSYRLRHLCETSNHKICEYFNAPKFI
jgi:hypothetical protein